MRQGSKADHHEFRSHQEIEASSDRSFGFVLSGAFLVFAALSIWHHGKWWPIYLVVSVVFGGLALVAPRLLAPANRLWTLLGIALSKVVNPVVMGCIFFLVFTPVAIFLRIIGSDMLNLRFNQRASSYWIVRDPPGPGARESMEEQF